MSRGFVLTEEVAYARLYARQEQIGGHQLAFHSPWPISDEMIDGWVERALRGELSPYDEVIAVTTDNELVQRIIPEDSDEI